MYLEKLESDRLQRDALRFVPAGGARLDQAESFHQANGDETEIVFSLVMARSEKVWVVMMIVLQTGAKRRRDRKPLAEVHRIVMLVDIAARPEPLVMRPVVLDHVYP